MPFDPAAGFSLDPDAALRERVRDLERRAVAFGGAASAYAEDLATVSTTGLAWTDLGGPSVSIRVPEGGAFVQLYAELEGNDIGNTGAPARALIIEPTDLPAAGSADGSYMEFQTAGAWEKRRLAPFTSALTDRYTLGAWSVYWASGGLRTYSYRYLHVLGNTASFRNRRLWARVTY